MTASPQRIKRHRPPELPLAAPSNFEFGVEPGRRITDELHRHAGIEGFLEAASQRLIAITDDQTAALGIEAVKIAAARGASAVDASDILAADAKLNHPPFAEQVRAWLFGVGGVLIGAGLSLAPALALTKQLEHAVLWWSAVIALLVIGAALAGLGFPRRRRN
ncbi:hypothetical protein F0Q45_21775 [Mycobacterium simiae]|uniref:Uncharacterized protein n=1 Tax=Mycobacterium simiae TaxID=1784 RepID=A0A5B1BHV7_MYCSI|nr:hypothetical protein [Mycobacterium simiae]KAA1248227.1 hypothetical protein F0Q45_21775 [Mycobacterium simiae]